MEIVRTILVDTVFFDYFDEDLQQIISRFTLYIVTKLGSRSVLYFFHDGIRPKEQKFNITQFICTSKLALEGCSLARLEDLLDSCTSIVDSLPAIVSTFVGGKKHLLIELWIVGKSIDDCARSNRSDGQMRVFISIPGRESARI